MQIHEQMKIACPRWGMVRIHGPRTVAIGDSVPNGKRTAKVCDPPSRPVVKRLSILGGHWKAPFSAELGTENLSLDHADYGLDSSPHGSIVNPYCNHSVVWFNVSFGPDPS